MPGMKPLEYTIDTIFSFIFLFVNPYIGLIGLIISGIVFINYSKNMIESGFLDEEETKERKRFLKMYKISIPIEIFLIICHLIMDFVVK